MTPDTMINWLLGAILLFQVTAVGLPLIFTAGASLNTSGGGGIWNLFTNAGIIGLIVAMFIIKSVLTKGGKK